jgi:hypothetical protein
MFPDKNVIIAFVALFRTSTRRACVYAGMLDHEDSDNITNFPTSFNNGGGYPPPLARRYCKIGCIYRHHACILYVCNMNTYELTWTENSTYLSVISLTDSVSAFNLTHSHSLLIFSSCFPLHSRHIAKNRERSILYCRRKKSRKRFQDKNKYLRDPIGTVFPKSKCASLVSCSVMTWFPVTAEFEPVWSGYWQTRDGRQNFPKLYRWLGQILICCSWSWEISNIPQRNKISSYSQSFSLDRWHLDKWVSTSSEHSRILTQSDFPRKFPHW